MLAINKSLKPATLAKEDPRSKLVLAKLKKENYRSDALIEVLHTVQNIYGYLPAPVVSFVTRELKIPPSRVYGVVSFYYFFSLKPKGEHTCLVCTGTACYVKGAEKIMSEIEKKYGLKAGDVTADNKLGLQTARCLGACGLAPAVVIDDEIVPKVNPEGINNLIEEKMGVLV